MPLPNLSRHPSPARERVPWAWTKKGRRRKLRAQPLAPAWEAYLKSNFLHDAWLSEADRAKLRDLVKVFVAEKRWEGCGGLEMTDEIRVTVGAMACLMLLGTEDYCFDGIRSVLVYPGAFVKPPQWQSAWGWIENSRPILGEAWRRGPVIISWAHALDRGRHPGELPNVVLHEFAHQIDGLDGEMGGTPPLRSRDEYRRWTRVVTAEYHRQADSIRRGEPTWFDPYAASSEAEFFAVITEHFFEQPVRLQESFAELYGVLADFYRQDPATWRR
jgi:Mlc titration factor MtfA (ptsG expression regulator)